MSMLCSTYIHYQYSMYHTSITWRFGAGHFGYRERSIILGLRKTWLSMSTPWVRMCCRAEARSRKGLISRRSENE